MKPTSFFTGQKPPNIARHLQRIAVLFAVLAGSAAADDTSFPASFDPFPYSFSRVGGEYRLGAGTGYTYYYIAFERTTDLRQPFATVALALGSPAPLFGYTPGPGEPQGFFHLAAIDVFSPRDTDGDGMDDLWELNQNLDPMDPADAHLTSAADPSKTNLEYYRNRFGLGPVTLFYSLETTVFNAPSVVSQEASVFNFPNFTGASIESISKEVSVFNFPAFTGASTEAMSKEVSVFNFSVFAGASTEAVSSELSVFNFPTFAGASAESISRELSVFNFPASSGPNAEAISREVSVLKP